MWQTIFPMYLHLLWREYGVPSEWATLSWINYDFQTASCFDWRVFWFVLLHLGFSDTIPTHPWCLITLSKPVITVRSSIRKESQLIYSISLGILTYTECDLVQLEGERDEWMKGRVRSGQKIESSRTLFAASKKWHSVIVCLHSICYVQRDMK